MSLGASFGVAQDTLSGWSAQAIRDTVASIASDDVFQRVGTQSLFDRFFLWLGRLFGEFLRLLPDVRLGKLFIVGGALVVAALIIARLVLRRRAEREIWAGERGEAWRSRRVDPWLEAERLAGQGSYVEAAHALCASLISVCARRGEVVLHPSKTTGDYAREMRRRGSPSEGAFQRFRSRYERLVYDAQRCSPEDYRALLDDARPLFAPERAA